MSMRRELSIPGAGEFFNLQRPQQVNGRAVEVVSVTFTHINRQPEMLVRPYTPAASGREAIESIASAIESNAGGAVTPSMVASIGAGKLFAPSGVPVGSLMGREWVDDKLAVKIVLRIHHQLSGKIGYSYLSGYTDYAGYHMYGSNAIIDPNMMIFITSAMTTSVRSFKTPNGMVQEEEVLTGNLNTPTSRTGSHELFYGLRPCDIAQHVADAQLTAHVDGCSITNASTEFAVGGNSALPSRPVNNIGSSYISSIVNSALNWRRRSEGSMDSYGLSDVTSLQGVEPGIRSIAGLAEISTAAGYYNRPSTTFPFDALNKIDPGTDEKTTVIQKDLGAGLRVSRLFDGAVPDAGEHWEGSQFETKIAYTLLQETIALAEGYGLGMVKLSANNYQPYIPVQDQVAILDADTGIMRLSDASFSHQLRLFADQFAITVWQSLNQYGRDLDVDVEYDGLNTSRVRIRVDDGNDCWYTCPTVGAALAAPVWSPNNEQVLNMAHAIDTVSNTVADMAVSPIIHY